MSLLKEFIVPTGVLAAICIVVSAALSGTYAITTPIIEENQRREAHKALAEIFPASEAFEEKTEGLPQGVEKLNIAQNGTGYVAQVSVGGYGGPISMMVGIGEDGMITGVKVLEASETQGLGSKVTDPAYTEQFSGKENPEEVASIAGATVTSKAIKEGIVLAKSAGEEGA